MPVPSPPETDSMSDGTSDDWSRRLREQGVPEHTLDQARAAGARLAEAATDAVSDFDEPLDPPRMLVLLRDAATARDD